MAQNVSFSRKLTKAQIEALSTVENGKVYFASDGGIYVGTSSSLIHSADVTPIVTGFQTTPDDTHVPSEKLVNDTFEKKDSLASDVLTAGFSKKVSVNGGTAVAPIADGTISLTGICTSLKVGNVGVNPDTGGSIEIAGGSNVTVAQTTNKVTISATTYSAEKGISLNDGKFGHSNSAITAVTTSKLLSTKVDSYGHITEYTEVGTESAPVANASNLRGRSGAYTYDSLNTAITTINNSLQGIEGKIPSAASTNNKLADKAFVNSSIATNTATFQGTYDSTSKLPTSHVKNNDYAYVITTQAEANPLYDRYKYTVTDGVGAWAKEFTLNNSSYTQAQWDAINSGITATKVGNLDTAVQSITVGDTSCTKTGTAVAIPAATSSSDGAMTSTQVITLSGAVQTITMGSGTTQSSGTKTGDTINLSVANPGSFDGLLSAADAQKIEELGYCKIVDVGHLAGGDSSMDETRCGQLFSYLSSHSTATLFVDQSINTQASGGPIGHKTSISVQKFVDSGTKYRLTFVNAEALYIGVLTSSTYNVKIVSFAGTTGPAYIDTTAKTISAGGATLGTSALPIANSYFANCLGVAGNNFTYSEINNKFTEIDSAITWDD